MLFFQKTLPCSPAQELVTWWQCPGHRVGKETEGPRRQPLWLCFSGESSLLPPTPLPPGEVAWPCEHSRRPRSPLSSSCSRGFRGRDSLTFTACGPSGDDFLSALHPLTILGNFVEACSYQFCLSSFLLAGQYTFLFCSPLLSLGVEKGDEMNQCVQPAILN